MHPESWWSLLDLLSETLVMFLIAFKQEVLNQNCSLSITGHACSLIRRPIVQLLMNRCRWWPRLYPMPIQHIQLWSYITGTVALANSSLTLNNFVIASTSPTLLSLILFHGTTIITNWSCIISMTILHRSSHQQTVLHCVFPRISIIIGLGCHRISIRYVLLMTSFLTFNYRRFLHWLDETWLCWLLNWS